MAGSKAGLEELLKIKVDLPVEKKKPPIFKI
jgi:hypothetical protein